MPTQTKKELVDKIGKEYEVLIQERGLLRRQVNKFTREKLEVIQDNERMQSEMKNLERSRRLLGIWELILFVESMLNTLIDRTRSHKT